MTLGDITADSVLAALAEYDRLGQSAFLAKYGFQRSRKFLLIRNGHTYDSKAIVGAAHEYATGQSLPADEFNGGAQTVRPLLALGFDIRDASAQKVMDPSGTIGNIPGVAPGTEYGTRQAVRDAGVHRALQAGIVGTQQSGAESVVVSGGYEDDEDSGTVIVYTGHGGRDDRGRQVADQTFQAPGNAALLSSKLSGAPVRVVRGAHQGSSYAPTSGYRYDGLFSVEDSWRERGRSGYLVCRFRMRDLYSERRSKDLSELDEGIERVGVQVPTGAVIPDRRTTTANRLVRSISVAEYVKSVHANRCQVCGLALDLGGRRYSEAAHIQALGRPHNGPDAVNNVLCLCPNCHVLFDNGALAIDEKTLTITSNGSFVGTLRTDERHIVDPARLRYHRSAHQ